jgi:CRISPR-associated protein Cmr4
MDARMLYVHALSPIHSGTGQSSGVVDLPVAREAVFNWPYLPGSSIKGVLRDACDPGLEDEDPAQRLFYAAFGPSTDRASEGAGSLWFPDAHLLCLPVRSYCGTLAWVTCPLALERWRRDHLSAGLPFTSAVPRSPGEEAILTGPGCAIASEEQEPKVYLEDVDLEVADDSAVELIARQIASAVFEAEWQERFLRRFGIVSDNLFTFLAETTTEVTARIKLEAERKAVQGGALWYEEAVPAESIFACPVLAAPRNGATATDLYGVVAPHLNGLLQIGGGASVGRGLVAIRLLEVTA